jgi:hypothetical protein
MHGIQNFSLVRIPNWGNCIPPDPVASLHKGEESDKMECKNEDKIYEKAISEDLTDIAYQKAQKEQSIHQKTLETFRKYWNKYHGSVSIENALMPNTTITRNEWRNAGQRIHTTTKQTWELKDHCKYCTDFLIERPEADAEDPCQKCGIHQAILNEQEGFNQ